MFKCIIHIYGLPHEISDLQQVEVELKDGASMGDVIAALRGKIQALEGPVIRTGEDRLVEYYKFNVNGLFYFDGMDFQLQSGDRVALLMPVTGG
jgi:molybdopterin converting factor small subunit